MVKCYDIAAFFGGWVMSQRIEQPRFRVYEPLPTPWRFQDLPLEHEARQTALFVVHGIGTQAYYDTAVELRSGFEDAIHQICQERLKAAGTTGDSQEMLPPPFIYEGYWANYASLEETFPEHWATLTERERLFFARLWQRRSMGTFHTAWWFIQQNLRLYSRKTIKDFGYTTGLTVMGMSPLTILAIMAMSVASPRVLAEVISDVRIYCDPRGSIEEAIVQRIDRRVGEQFLKLLGLDWEFRDLPPDQLLNVSGKSQVFDYVTWISHSLGTVISYNVISDILHRVEKQSQDLKARRRRGQESDQDRQLRLNLERVKRGLHRFFTLGSPLHSIARLFPDILRHWPASTEQIVLGDKKTQNWWVNFYHAWDPISERLGEKFPLAINRHSGRLWRIPGKAHSDYWRDGDILKYIISRAYGPDLCRWPDPRFLSDRAYLWARRALLILITLIALAILALAVWWLAFGGGALWLLRKAALWLKRLF